MIINRQNLAFSKKLGFFLIKPNIIKLYLAAQNFVCRAPPLFKKKSWDWGIYTARISILDMNLNGDAGVMSVKEGT